MKNIIKKLLLFVFIMIISVESIATSVSDNDGSAFITKAEFDSLKNNFQSQIDAYNQSIDSKIDSAIASYLSGIRLETKSNLNQLVDIKDIEWTKELASTIKNVNVPQYQIFPHTYFSAGSTGNSHWVTQHFEMWENNKPTATELGVPTAPVNYGGYYLVVDDRTLSTKPYLYEMRYMTPNGGTRVSQTPSGTTYYAWKAASTSIGSVHIRGVDCIFYAVEGRCPSFSATISKNEMTMSASYSLRYAENSARSASTDSSYSSNVVIDVFNEGYTNALTKDYRKCLFCCIPDTSSIKFPLYDDTNKFNWKIETQTGVNIVSWNAYMIYMGTAPTDTDQASTFEGFSISAPYPKMNDTDTKSNRDFYADFYSNFLYENGYPNEKMTVGAPFLKTNNTGSKVTFKIKNNGFAANSFVIKEDEFTTYDGNTGINMKINDVSCSGHSSNIAAGNTVNVEFEGKSNATFWFKSIGAGKWEIVGDIVETMTD